MAARPLQANSQGFPEEQMIRNPRPPLAPMAAALMIAIVLPVYFWLGDLLLTPTRLVCLIAIPIFLARLFAGAFGRLLLTDFLILFYSFWVMLAYFMVHGTAQLVYAGLQVTLILGGYLVGRATIRSPADMMAMSRLLATLVILLLPFAAIEGITGRYVIPELIRSTGFLGSVSENNYGERLGLFRAQVVFVHPIHFGLYCSLALSLYFVTRINHVPFMTRMIVAGLILLSVFFSVSSGPFLAAVFQIALIGYLLMFHAIQNQWKLLLWAFGIFYAIIEVSSDRFGMYAVASRLAFNSSTAFYRSLIWQYGTAQVERTPFFGVGRNWWGQPHWMSWSIDNFWLQIAVVNGLPSSLCMIAIFLITMIRAGRGHYVRGSDAYHVRVGYTFLFIGLMLSLATVTIWNEVLCMIMFLIGAGQYMQQATAPAVAPEAAAAEAADPAGSSRRKTHRRRTDPAEVIYTRFPPQAGRKGAAPPTAT